MKPLKLVVILILLAALGFLLSWNSRDSNDAARLIRQAEAGSTEALDQLELLSAAGELAAHSDLVGAAATRVSRAASETDPPRGFLSRWHRLFFATDPLQNASEETRTEFVRSLFRIEPILPDEVLAGEKHSVGHRVVGLLPHTEIDELDGYGAWASLKSIVANGSEVWPSGLTSERMWRLAYAKGSSGGASYQIVLLDDDHTLAPGAELTITMVLDMSVMDESTDPPTVFAEWTEELVATPKVKTIFTSSPVLPRPGDASFDEVLALLAQTEDADEEAAEKLVTLGGSGELRPYANELGGLLAQALRDEWRPRVGAYFEEHGWEPESPGAHPLPKPNDQTALLIGLFYLAEPVSTATRETWLDVASAGVYAHHHLRLDTKESRDARLQIKILTVLVQSPSLAQVSGVGITMHGMEFDGRSWPLQMSSTQRVTSISPQPAAHWRNHLTGMVSQNNLAHGLSEEVISRLALREGQTIDDLRTHLELRLMHDDEISLATWPVTISTPVPLSRAAEQPLDETPQDRR
ncbi:MAG: hypothetical protein ACNA8P_00590 [Phycisphaerales bacterium]